MRDWVFLTRDMDQTASKSDHINGAALPVSVSGNLIKPSPSSRIHSINAIPKQCLLPQPLSGHLIQQLHGGITFASIDLYLTLRIFSGVAVKLGVDPKVIHTPKSCYYNLWPFIHVGRELDVRYPESSYLHLTQASFVIAWSRYTNGKSVWIRDIKVRCPRTI
jgi:hypothetical protein